MKTQEKEQIQRRRIAHHRALETLRAPDCQLSGIQIWRKLHEIERLANAGACAYCNGERIRIVWPVVGPRDYDFDTKGGEAWDQLRPVVVHLVRNIFGAVPAGFFVNGDARGHTLKLDSDKVSIPVGMQTDWGQDGILAAEINAE